MSPNPVGGPRHLFSNPGPDSRTLLPSADTANTAKSLGEAKTLTPQQYADAISEHARQTTVSSQFPGYGFENLAGLLCRGFEDRQLPRPVSMRQSLKSALPTFPFLSSYKFTNGPFLEGPSYHNDPCQYVTTNEKPCPSVLFLRGKPSSMWLSKIGAEHRVDPEFFNRHLDFRSTFGRIDYFSSPSFPSAQPWLLQLPYITIGQVENGARLASQQSLRELRNACADQFSEYHKSLHRQFDCDHGTGDSLVRDFHVHDDFNFAIEQRISIALNEAFGSWQLLIWLDSGKPLSEGLDGPWTRLTSDTHNNSHGRSTLVVYPTIQVKPMIALKSHRHRIDMRNDDRRKYDNLAQSASLLATEYGKQLDPLVMLQDPFYALHDIFSFVAFSYRQYFNMLEHKEIKRTRIASGAENTRPGQPNPSQWDSTNLLYDRSILEVHITHIRYMIDLVQPRTTIPAVPNPKYSWPNSNDPQIKQRAVDAAQLLLKYFKDLEAQAERLLNRYRDDMNVSMNLATVAEANKSLAQAKEVAKLTKLAFVYVPLSFTASFFGMNVSPLNGNGSNDEVPLWVWFLTSALVLVVSLILLVWDVKVMASWAGGSVLKMRSSVLRSLPRSRRAAEDANDVKQDG